MVNKFKIKVKNNYKELPLKTTVILSSRNENYSIIFLNSNQSRSYIVENDFIDNLIDTNLSI